MVDFGNSESGGGGDLRAFGGAAPGPSKQGDGWKDRKKKPRTVDLSRLLDRLPPQAIEAEMALLGSMILDWRTVGDVVQVLVDAEVFHKPEHQSIYAVLVELYDKHQSIDMVQLHAKLSDRGVLEQVGGLDYLVELGEAVPSASGAVRYAEIVRDKALLRKMIHTAGTILEDCHGCDEPVVELFDKIESTIFEIAEKRTQDGTAALSVLLQETFDKLEAQDGQVITGVETGFKDLDEMTNGLQPGELIIVAARPSMGKTAFALNVSEHIGAVAGRPVGVFSLEMSKQQLAQRLLCSRSQVNSHRLRRNMLSREDFSKLSHAVGELSEAPIYIDDTAGLTLMGLRAKARRMKQRYGIEALMVDYLQLMSNPSTKDGRQNEVSAISRGVKALARELECPIICLSQLNRAAEQREGHRPRMSDLRESGSIEQDADVIMMLHREDYYHRGDPEHVDNNEAEVIVTKQRNGPTGTVKLMFDGGTTRFKNLALGGSSPSY
ncbi:replicative DNA helicase [Phycisphaera mikurensis]|uniref:Replicative DNA helicase n=1 Tax=Phycisphaera mikurensis (strain NBRC 102666 / KCTC 22515 / FYK2301M01) TaxID=1142394 RepID=I0IDY3_PHYMF|nr:replicative DNA helicase [Phycisphaera mikurensis]MBB6441278.1 replicative DNA helicase [Phycisphaera mikurensis]BAM03471.1 replicative DNA helicase [Phycisphaera mikurensis NBRC 102666]